MVKFLVPELGLGKHVFRIVVKNEDGVILNSQKKIFFLLWSDKMNIHLNDPEYDIDKSPFKIVIRVFI